MTGHRIYNQNQTKVSSDVSVMVNRIWNYERDRDKEEVELRRGWWGVLEKRIQDESSEENIPIPEMIYAE